jgi:hypothetical protein
VLLNSPAVFCRLPPFQAAVAQRIPQLIQAQLQDHLDAGAAGASFATASFATFKSLLRLARTLLRNFCPLLGPRSGTLVQALLAGEACGAAAVSPSFFLLHQAFCRRLCHNPCAAAMEARGS